ncbi:MAG: hypothetical protein KC591_06890, partial [Gemmatimonadetes bacterium]|nr:hypothetical protein [Gemmatimonadota bacterium]
MSRTRLLGLAAALIAVGLSAVPASASRQDSWLGHSFMWHLSDVVAYPHRAVQDDWQNEAIAIFVPRNTTSGAPPDERGTPVYDGFDYLQGTVTFGSDNWSLIFAGNEQRGYNPVKAIGTHERMP